ncbi:hypothetical protein MMC13_004881 [Lambiella insularis]|nr:hypothetical protein [Lambiella insularis]
MTFGRKLDATFTVTVGDSSLTCISLLEALSHINPMAAGGDADLSGAQRTRSANRDKLAIVLNISHLGLLIKPDAFDAISDLQSLSVQHCRALAALSLAANEPMALRTTGDPVAEFPTSEINSWLGWFGTKDWQNQTACPLELPLMDSPYLKFDTDHVDHHIELQLCGFEPGLRIETP